MLLKIKLFPHICAQQMIYERILMRFSVSDVGSVMLSQSRGHVAGRTATRYCPQRPFLQACLLSALRPSIVADPSSSYFSETFSTRHLYILFGTSPTALFIALRGLCLCWGIFLSLLPRSLDPWIWRQESLLWHSVTLANHQRLRTSTSSSIKWEQ